MNKGGTGKRLSFTTRTFSTKCKTLVCAPPEQCTIPWISGRSASSNFFTTGAYVRVGESTNLPASIGEFSTLSVSFNYPTVARRIVEKKAKLNVPNTSDGMQTITFKPLDPGIVLEKLVVDYGGYKKSYLFMNESKSKRESR